MSCKRVPLRDVADLTLGKMLDDKKNRGTFLPYLANVNVRWGAFELNDLRQMRFESHEVECFGLKAGDIVMCEGGEPGRCAIWKDHQPMMIQKALHRIRPRNGLNNKFLFYSFLHKGKTGGFSPLFTGSTITHLPKEKLKLVEIVIPPVPVQERIVSVLCAYDDLIENNRRRIQLLEQSARLLYKEWFVHLRFPGHEHAKIKDGVPEGWKSAPLSACVTFQSGGTPSKSNPDFWNGSIPWISSGELTGIRLSTSKHRVTEDAVLSGSRFAEVGTILGVVRGMSLAKEFRLGIAAKRVCFNQDLKAFVPDRGIESLYLFHALDEQRDRIRQQAGEASHGTKKLETAVLENLRIMVAMPSVRQHFVEHVSAFHSQMDVLIQQNRRLERARDLLLPRLMSGELTA